MTNEEYLLVAKDLASLNMSIEGHPYDEAIDTLEEKILTHQYRIAVVGDFSTGKSTFINALLGEELLYFSTKEATGVITTVQYGEKSFAQICKKTDSDIADKVIEEIDLTDSVGKERLNQYLNIENKLIGDQVNIYYPLQGIEKDIVFFDTPGIEKLSQEQVKMTKRVINESNAVIFLITKKGFTNQALKVIAGEHEVIGKIPSKDMMVVMTHIGEIYDNRNSDEALFQINRVVNEAKQQLKQKNLLDVSVYPLDSKDYLWGINSSVYCKETKKRNINLNGTMLEQKEYRERSNFDAFKRRLYDFLDSDNLQKSREQDINNTIVLIADIIELELNKQKETGSGNNIVLKNQLEKQIEMACENQRKFYNRLIRQLQGHMDDFLENVEKDTMIEVKNNINMLSLIQYTFQTIADINEANVRKCIKKTVEDIELFSRKVENETNNHIEITCDSFVKSVFSEQFQEIFSNSIEVKIEKPSCDLSLVLKKDDYNADSVINDSDLEAIKKEICAEQKKISELEQKINELKEVCQNMNTSYIKQKKSLDKWYDLEMNRLGKRPKAVQKYRQELRSKGILFWKKTWYKDVPDGMDNSAGLEWDKKQRYIMKLFEEKSDAIETQGEKAESDNRSRSQCENSLQEHKSKLKHLESKRKKYSDYIEEGKRKYVEAYIGEKKEDVASYCDLIRNILLNQVREIVRSHLYDSKKEIENAIKKELTYQINRYRTELNEKNKALCENIKVTEETQEHLLNRIKSIKEKVKYGKTV